MEYGSHYCGASPLATPKRAVRHEKLDGKTSKWKIRRKAKFVNFRLIDALVCQPCALNWEIHYEILLSVYQLTNPPGFSDQSRLAEFWPRGRSTEAHSSSVHTWLMGLLCLLATATAYFRIFRIVRHHQEQIQAQRQVQDQAGNQDDDDAAVNLEQQKKSSITKFLIYCLLLICYVPSTVMNAAGFKTTGSSDVAISIYDMSFILLLSNSMLNPVIYCWRFEKIPAAVVETTMKMWRKLRNPSPPA